MYAKYLLMGTITAIIFFLFVFSTSAKQQDKVVWCHVDANGNPLHAGDHPGECAEPTSTPTPTLSEDNTPTPTLEISPTATPTPTLTSRGITPTTPPAPGGDGKSDGRSDGNKSSDFDHSQPIETLPPCTATTCGWK